MTGKDDCEAMEGEAAAKKGKERKDSKRAAKEWSRNRRDGGSSKPLALDRARATRWEGCRARQAGSSPRGGSRELIRHTVWRARGARASGTNNIRRKACPGFRRHHVHGPEWLVEKRAATLL